MQDVSIFPSLFSLLLALTFTFSAFADDSQKVLDHSMVKSLGEMMIEKHQGQCTLPTTAKDIHWMCMGALHPMTKLQITASSFSSQVIWNGS